jgi:arsenate reductase (thioredoxin)
MSERKYNILFLCTANSARSIMAEVLANHVGKGRFRAYSAGSFPGGEVNPLAIETLKAGGFATEGLRSKSWDEFAAKDAPQMDFIITVCDNAANEVCPVWPGKPATAHWGVPDPAALEGTDEQRRVAFREAANILRRRIELLAALPIEKVDKLSMLRELRSIGQK